MGMTQGAVHSYRGKAVLCDSAKDSKCSKCSVAVRDSWIMGRVRRKFTAAGGRGIMHPCRGAPQDEDDNSRAPFRVQLDRPSNYM